MNSARNIARLAVGLTCQRSFTHPSSRFVVSGTNLFSNLSENIYLDPGFGEWTHYGLNRHVHGSRREPLFSKILSPDKFKGGIRRGLIVETCSQPVRMQRLPGSDNGIIEVILDRPETRNAIGNDMLKCLQHILETINDDSSARVVMLCSSLPKVFCAGADLKKMWNSPGVVPVHCHKLMQSHSGHAPGAVDWCLTWFMNAPNISRERRRMNASEAKIFVNSLRSTFSFLEALSIPTISVIEGAALGGGLELILSCDLRVSGDEATFGMPETGLAIIPGAGGTQRLPRLIGRSQAKDLIFTGRRVDGKQAVAIGLVDHCVTAGDAYSKALEIARDINQKGPLSIKLAKIAIDRGCEVDSCSGMFVEETCYAEVLNSKDRLEGLAAFAEKRKPNYSGN